MSKDRRTIKVKRQKKVSKHTKQLALNQSKATQVEKYLEKLYLIDDSVLKLVDTITECDDMAQIEEMVKEIDMNEKYLNLGSRVLDYISVNEECNWLFLVYEAVFELVNDLLDAYEDNDIVEMGLTIKDIRYHLHLIEIIKNSLRYNMSRQIAN